MRMLAHQVKGEVIDLRSVPTDMSVAARRLIGQQLFEDGANGVLYRTEEVPGYDFLAVFSVEILADKAVQGAHYRFRWDGHQVSRIFDFTRNGDIDRGDVFAKPRAAA